METPARRWLECPLQHRIKARANHLWIVNRANLLPEITKHWGIAVEDRAQLEAQDRQWALQEVAFQAPEYEQDDILTWPKRGKKRMQVFTDGSGAPAENAKWRRTGYGIALLDGLPHSAPATGRQSVPRAELQAAVVAAEAFRLPVDINTDCAYVCRVDANARMPFRKSPYLSSNGDLVARWKKMVSDNPDRVATTKIKARRSLDDSKGSVDAMQIVYNDLADGAANKGRQMHESEWWNLKRYEAGRRRLVLAMQHLMLEVNAACIEHEKDSRTAQTDEQRHPRCPLDYGHAWQRRVSPVPPGQIGGTLRKVPYPKAFVQRVVTWLQTLQYASANGSSTDDDRDITFVELAINFLVVILRDQDARARLVPSTPQAMSNCILTVVQALGRAGAWAPLQGKKNLAFSLRWAGLRTPIVGTSKRPVTERTKETFDLIERYFTQNSARVRTGSTKQPLKYSTAVPDERFGIAEAALAGVDPARLTEADRLKAKADDERTKQIIESRCKSRVTGQVKKPALTGVKPSKQWLDTFFGKKSRYTEPIPVDARDRRKAQLVEMPAYRCRMAYARHLGHHDMMKHHTHAVAVCVACTAYTVDLTKMSAKLGEACKGAGGAEVDAPTTRGKVVKDRAVRDAFWTHQGGTGGCDECERQRIEAAGPDKQTLGVGVGVKLAGLVGAAAFNGRKGNCENWVESTGRWVVRLDDQSLKNVRPDNLAPANVIRKQPHSKVCAAAFTAWKDSVDHKAIADAAASSALAPVRERAASALDDAKKQDWDAFVKACGLTPGCKVCANGSFLKKHTRACSTMRDKWQKAGRPLKMTASDMLGGRRALTAQMAPVREKADAGRRKLVAASWQPVEGNGGASSSSTDPPLVAPVHLAAVEAAEDSVDSEDDCVWSLRDQQAAAGAPPPGLAAPSSSRAWSVPTPLGRRTPLAGRRQ